LILVHDQSRTAKSRNYRRSVNVEVVVRRRDRRVVAVGHAWPGNRNDVAVWKGCGVAAAVTGHGRLIGDGGYRGAPDLTSPKLGPGGSAHRP